MIRVLIFLAFSNIAFAIPKNIEVWFISIDQTTMLENFPRMKKNSLYSRNLQCQPMGEYCFDPQVGLYKKGDDSFSEVDQSKVENDQKYEFINPHKGVERSIIECDKNSNFFDVFCGKAKGSSKAQNSKLEIWVDTSSTMKQVDFAGFSKQCQRERFLKSLRSTCQKTNDLNIYFFEEFRKQAGALDRVCLSSGLNDMNRIISDLKKSKADHVLIITDIFEAEEKFIDALEALGPTKILGLKRPMYSSMIMKEVKRIRSLCI